MIFGLPIPSIIDNSDLFDENDYVKKDLRKNINYKFVNPYIWQILSKIHNSGNLIIHFTLQDIEDTIVLKGVNIYEDCI